MNLTVAQLAESLQGSVEGDGAAAITGLAGLKEAEPGELSFLANPRYASLLQTTRATAVIVGGDFAGTAACTLIRVANADAAFAAAALRLGPPPPARVPGVHPTAVLAADAVLGDGVSVGPHCVIESGARIGAGTVLVACVYVGHQVVVGADCLFYPFVTVRERVTVGSRVILHSGAVVGSDGFGYVRERTGWKKIPQIGTVELGDDVELGANVTVDRARFGKTVIARGAKIDNLVQIAHNCSIGENTAMAAQVGISGSTTVGRDCMLGGQAGFAGHLHVGDRVVVLAQSGVMRDIPDGGRVFGAPAVPEREAFRVVAATQQLPELRKQVREMEKRLARLEGKGAQA